MFKNKISAVCAVFLFVGGAGTVQGATVERVAATSTVVPVTQSVGIVNAFLPGVRPPPRVPPRIPPRIPSRA